MKTLTLALLVLLTGCATTDRPRTVIESHDMGDDVTCYVAMSWEDQHRDPRSISCVRAGGGA